jgi:hypothetical protein
VGRQGGQVLESLGSGGDRGLALEVDCGHGQGKVSGGLGDSAGYGSGRPRGCAARPRQAPLPNTATLRRSTAGWNSQKGRLVSKWDGL